MRRKQLAKRVAIAVLSAATVMTAAPVGAFAAQNVTFEASDANAANGYDEDTTDANSITGALEAKLEALKSSDNPNGTTYSLKSSATTLDSALLNDLGFNISTGADAGTYTLSKAVVTGATAPSYDAKADKIVMPVVSVTADLMKGEEAKGTVSFTIDATELTRAEQLKAAKAVLEGKGGTDKDAYSKKDNADDAEVYGNDDNSTSLEKAVIKILADYKTQLPLIVNSEGTGFASFAVGDGVTVTKGTSSAATKDAAGSETVNIALKYTPVTGDAGYDATKTAQTPFTESATYTATIPALGTTSQDSDYQSAIEKALSTVTFTNTELTGIATGGGTAVTLSRHTDAVAKVNKALQSVGIKEEADGSNITVRRYIPATHKADGSIEILVDTKRDTDSSTNVEYASVTVPVTHSDDGKAVEAEVSKQVGLAATSIKKDPSLIQADDATKTPTKDEIKAAIKAVIDKNLAKTLGGSKTIASEIKKYEVVDLTAGKNNSYTYQVKVTFNNDVNDTAPKAEKTYRGEDYTFTLPDVKEVTATNISFPATTDVQLSAAVKGVEVKPTLTPANANAATIRWTVDSDQFEVDTKKMGEAVTGTTAGANAYKKTTLALKYKATATPAVGDTAKVTAQLINADGLVVATATTTVNVVSGFTDVQNPHSYEYAPVNYLAQGRVVYKNNNYERVSVIEGVGDNKFNPTGEVTRGQFVTFLYRLAEIQGNGGRITPKTYSDESFDADTTKKLVDLGVYSPNGESAYKRAKNADGSYVSYPVFKDSDAQTKFTDVDSKAYYAKAVDWAVANGIASGTSDTTFEPNKTVTRAEAVTFLQRYFAAGQQYNASSKFDDVKSTDWFAGAVGWATSNGVTQGKDDEHFAPNDTTTRAEAAAFIYRADSNSKINK